MFNSLLILGLRELVEPRSSTEGIPMETNNIIVTGIIILVGYIAIRWMIIVEKEKKKKGEAIKMQNKPKSKKKKGS